MNTPAKSHTIKTVIRFKLRPDDRTLGSWKPAGEPRAVNGLYEVTFNRQLIALPPGAKSFGVAHVAYTDTVNDQRIRPGRYFVYDPKATVTVTSRPSPDRPDDREVYVGRDGDDIKKVISMLERTMRGHLSPLETASLQ